MALLMSDEDIKKDFLGAKDRRKQITILADLNATTEENIRAHLVRAGIPHQQLPRKRKSGTFTLSAAEEDAAPSDNGTASDETIAKLLKDNDSLRKKLMEASDLTSKLMSDVEEAHKDREAAYAELDKIRAETTEKARRLVEEIEALERELARRDKLIITMVERMFGGA